MGLNIPVSGGGYFRLYPAWLTLHWLTAINGKAGRPFLFYVHPWEVDPDQPRLPAGTRISRWRHRVNLATTERKLDHLLMSFAFGPMGQVLERHIQPAASGQLTADEESERNDQRNPKRKRGADLGVPSPPPAKRNSRGEGRVNSTKVRHEKPLGVVGQKDG